jgi:hypothetical protein
LQVPLRFLFRRPASLPPRSLFGWAATGWAGPAAGNQPPQPSTSHASHTSHFRIQTAEQEAGAFFSIFGAKPISILM